MTWEESTNILHLLDKVFGSKNEDPDNWQMTATPDGSVIITSRHLPIRRIVFTPKDVSTHQTFINTLKSKLEALGWRPVPPGNPHLKTKQLPPEWGEEAP
jgi:hypothetical protein